MVAGKYLVTLSHGPQQALDAVDSLVELERNLVKRCAPSQGATCAQSPLDPPPTDSPFGEPGRDHFSDELRDGGRGPPMVAIPGGRFLMGCRAENNHRCGPSQGPLHYVQIPPFAISKYEVTFEDYDRYLHATGGSGRRDETDDEGWGRGNRPVINVLFEEAFAYIDWLSSQSGEHYRLPSESEWEYVARAGTDTAYSWGNEVGVNNANCLGCGSRWDYKTTAPVGSFNPNPWGVHDMHGNVLEMVQDCWFGDYRRAPNDGRARDAPWGVKIVNGRCFDRTVRGGAWNHHYRFTRASTRGWSTLERYGSVLGFRVARSPPVVDHATVPSGPRELRQEKRRR
ncbi:MAG: formylglycine-generating enzyme family protein [Gammaproteobacteria bacterium]|nr:formylglycine-generating enzyme family protein [Gammaproteobacteria bacterium]